MNRKLSLDCNFNEWQKEKDWHLTNDYYQYYSSISNLEDCQCCFCGAKDGKYLELHHINGNHDDYSLENLTTICSICHRSVHMGWACVDNCASLYYLPNDTGMRNLKDLDLAFHSVLNRLEIYNKLWQKKTPLLDNPKFLDLWTQDGWLKGRGYDTAVNLYLSLYDLLTGLQNNSEKQNDFFTQQYEGKKGIILLRFNPMVFKPLRTMPFTYNERINDLRVDKVLSPNNFDKLVQNTIANLQAQDLNLSKPTIKFDKEKLKIKEAQTESITEATNENGGDGE